MRLSRMTTAGLLTIICLGGCSAGELKQQNALLTQENEGLRSELGQRNMALADAQATLREKDNELARLRDQPAQAPLAQVTGFESIPNVTTSYGAGEITVSVSSDVLFAPGKTALKSAAQHSLDEVAGVLNRSYGDYLIRVEGHTDKDPIRKSGFKTNYHLGFERAYAVREYLVGKGVAAERISLSSYGPDQPQATKDASRRVEIVVYQ